MSIFKFKQFEVDQKNCAMKINTDGVLIGAIAGHSRPENILDIGTGTGVIALMLAQRFQEAKVYAVEIDEPSVQTAQANFKNSQFNHRLSVTHIGIAAYEPTVKFDMIVSNPPFFVNDLKNTALRKGIARHASTLFFDDLINKCSALLAPGGKIWLILPVKQAVEVIKIAVLHQLHLEKRVHLHSDKTKPTFRQIICLSHQPEGLEESDFYIYESPRLHTPAYEQLLKDFFLAY